MKELFIMKSKGKQSLFPVVVSLGKQVENIFAVPEKDAIGTIDIDNAISFLIFDDDKIKIKIIKKDFAKEVSGDFEFSFLPVYSDEEISYGQTRWIIFQNLKTKENKTEFIINNLDDYLGKIAVLDPHHKVFVIEILKPHGRIGYDKNLHLVKFKKDGFDVIEKINAGIKSLAYTEPWCVGDEKLFVYDDSVKAIKVFNENGKEATHPFYTVFTTNKDKFRRIKEILFHPEFPFALILEIGNDPDVEDLQKQRDNGIITIEQYDSITDPMYEERDRHAIWLSRWDTQDESKQLTPLISDAGNLVPSLDLLKMCSDFQFSPDGKWLVFRDETEMDGRENPVFISIPVSDKLPNYLGEPLFLGKIFREASMLEARGTAWINKPTSFVMTDGMVLYKWELGNIDKAKIINQ